MAVIEGKKISQLTSVSTPANDDEVVLIDKSDISQSASGSTKRMSRQAFLQGVSPEGATVDRFNTKQLGVLHSTNPPAVSAGQLVFYTKSDGFAYYMTPAGQEYKITSALSTAPPVVTPETPVDPNPIDPGDPPVADPVNFTQGNAVYENDGTTLATWDLETDTGGEPIVLDATGGVSGGSGLKFTLAATDPVTEVSLRKTMTGALVRDVKFQYKLKSDATLSNEHTLFHSWQGAGFNDFVQIRILPSTTANKFWWQIRTSSTPTSSFDLEKRSTVDHAKNVFHAVELYVTDTSFHLVVNGQAIINWFGFNNTNKYMDTVAMGKFYSKQLVGVQWIDDVHFYQDYVAPSGTPSEASKTADLWAAWKKRYIQADGKSYRPFGDGLTGNYVTGSDVVSEGVAYALMFAVQFNDQATFDLVHGFRNTHMIRSLNALPAGNLMGWHYDDVNDTMYDWNFATDAEIDAAAAYIWAHNQWGSGGSVNYTAVATAIIGDMKANAFRTISGKAYFAADAFQTANSPFEINPSYVSVGAFKIIKNFTGDTFWDTAIAGAYDLFAKLSANSGAIPTPVGLMPDWCGYTTGGAVALTPNGRVNSTKYSYDAFRTFVRVYWHYHWFSDSQALSLLSGVIRTFFKNEWTTNNRIFAEYARDGSVIGAYEKSFFTWAAWQVITAGNTSDTVGAAILSQKLSSLYVASPVGSYMRDNPSTSGAFAGAASYYNDSWMLFNMMVKNGYFPDIT